MDERKQVFLARSCVKQFFGLGSSSGCQALKIKQLVTYSTVLGINVPNFKIQYIEGIPI